MKMSLHKNARLSTFMLVIFTWFGMLNARVSYHLGGVAYVGIEYLLLICVLYPWRIRFYNDDYDLVAAIKWFLFFVCVMIAGTEVFQRYESAKSFGTIKMGNDTFHMISSFPIWLSFLLIQGLDKRSNGLVILTVGLILIDMLLTMYALEAIPNFAKNLAAGIVTDDMFSYKINGAMGYELTYSVVLLVPLLFANAYRKKNALLWATVLVSVVYVYRCSFMLALLMLIMNIGLSLVFSLKKKSLRIIVSIVFVITIVVLFMEKHIIGELLLSISEKVESIELKRRFQQMSDMFLYNDTSGDSLNRLSLYQNDVMGVIKSPVLGSYLTDPYFDKSGHSSVLGIWSSFGLMGIVPFFQMIRHMFRYSTAKIKSHSLRGIVLSAYVTFIILATFNPIFAAPHILLCVIWVIPILARNLDNRSCAT